MAIKYSGRGKELEKAINKTNQLYKKLGLALIIKNAVPTSFHGVKSSAPPDYQGCISNGKYIVFEAKQTLEESLPLANIKEHQYNFLYYINNIGGLAYLVIMFSQYSEYYLVPFDIIKKYWTMSRNGGRKSIPRTELSEYQCDIKDYLNLINKKEK